MTLENSEIRQLLIPVADLDRATRFYRDVLGLPFLFAAPPDMAFFRCGSIRLLLGATKKRASKSGSGSMIYFNVEDIKAVHKTLVERGVSFLAKPHLIHRTPTSRLFLAEFHDSEGNSLAIMSEVAHGG